MIALAHHVILRFADDRVIAPSLGERRKLARVVLKVGRTAPVLAFRATDNHLHVLVAGSERVARETARRIAIGLARALGPGVRFQAPRVRPLVDQGHLVNAFHYVLDLEARHGTEHDPAGDASNLPDLLGLRVIDTHTRERVGALLPRVSRARLLEHLGVPDLDAVVVTPARMLADLAGAAAAAYAQPWLEFRTRDAGDARAAAVHFARPNATIRALAKALGTTERTVYRLQRGPADPAAVRAIGMQLQLRLVLASRVPLVHLPLTPAPTLGRHAGETPAPRTPRPPRPRHRLASGWWPTGGGLDRASHA